MAKFFEAMTDDHQAFIARQHMFFTASAAADGRVNLSPKGMDTLRVLDAHTVAYLDLTGSGNETAAHVRASGRLTLMFCAFEGPPLILRLYGEGRTHPRGTPEFEALAPKFPDLAGARQVVVLAVASVQTSCGYAVPLYEYQGDRPTLVKWAEAKGDEGLETYRQEKNVRSIDGLPTGWPLA